MDLAPGGEPWHGNLNAQPVSSTAAFIWTVTERIPLKATSILDGFLSRPLGLPQIVVGMISIGIAGYLSSSIIRMIGDRAMPWRKLF
jgi:hypothetical protein